MGKRNRGRSGAKARAAKAKAKAAKGGKVIKTAIPTIKQIVKPIIKTGKAVLSTAGKVSQLGTALTAGAVIGEAYKNTDRAPAASGRGAGRATFRDSNNNNRPNVRNSTAPAKPAEMPVVTDPNGEVLKPDTNNPGFMVTPDGKSVRGDLTGGKGPISEDTDTGYPTLPTPTPTPTPTPDPTEDGGSGGSEPRTSVTGLNQYGKTLGGLNQFTKAFTGGYEVEDISKAFKSESLPTTENYSWNAKDNNGGYLEEGTWSEETNRIEPPSVPGTLGGNPDNPQDGTSAKPAVADKVRAIRVGRQSGLDDSDNDYPDDDSLVSPMYANERRNKIRRAFLDHEGSSVQAIAAANAVAGYGKDSDGNARFNVGGKLYGAKEGMEYKARNAAMSGENPMQYLDIPATPDTQPDSPAQSTLRISEADGFNETQQRAQDFFRAKLEERKNK